MNAKGYDPTLGAKIGLSLLSTSPPPIIHETATKAEKDTLDIIQNLLKQMMTSGDFWLCDRLPLALSISILEYDEVRTNPKDERHKLFCCWWDLVDSFGQSNAMCGNVNGNMKKWHDVSRSRGQFAKDEKVNINVQNNMFDIADVRTKQNLIRYLEEMTPIDGEDVDF